MLPFLFAGPRQHQPTLSSGQLTGLEHSDRNYYGIIGAISTHWHVSHHIHTHLPDGRFKPACVQICTLHESRGVVLQMHGKMHSIPHAPIHVTTFDLMLLVSQPCMHFTGQRQYACLWRLALPWTGGLISQSRKLFWQTLMGCAVMQQNSGPGADIWC